MNHKINDSYIKLQDNGFIKSLQSKLSTCFTVPEEDIIKQGENAWELFYISTGDCIVNIVDQNNREIENIRLLVEGDHFGEIALLYPGCKRTCTVVSRNYNTMAAVDHYNLRSLTSDYPEYKKLLIKLIHKYDDPKLNFLKKMMNKLTYVKGLSQEIIY